MKATILTILIFSGSFANAAAVEATINHVGIAVADLAKEQAWYQKAFDMKVEQEFSLPKPPLKTALLRAPNGLRIELIERKGAKRDRQFKDPMDATLSLGFGHCAIQVANLDDAFAKLKDDGATIVSPPSPGASPGWKFAYVKDPEGNLIEVLQIDPAKH